jgi:hypothetical protein
LHTSDSHAGIYFLACFNHAKKGSSLASSEVIGNASGTYHSCSEDQLPEASDELLERACCTHPRNLLEHKLK